MIFRLYPLPLDLTGTDNNNQVVREQHDLAKQFSLDYKIIVLDKGHFYKHSVTITDSFNRTLVAGEDYQTTMFNHDIFAQSGHEACAVIVVTNKDVRGLVYVTAQMVGDKYCKLGAQIAQQSLGVLNNTRKLKYRNIKELPDTFTLNGHMHPYYDLYGFMEKTLSVERIIEKYRQRLSKDYLLLYADFNKNLGGSNSELGELERVYGEHIARLDNPHQVVKKQVGLEFVVNGKIATVLEAQSLNKNLLNTYTTPLTAARALDSNFIIRVTQHVNDKSNPHKVTAGQLGAYTGLEISDLAYQYYNINETVGSSMNIGAHPGKTFESMYPEARAGLNAADINRGYLKMGNLTDDYPYEPSVLVPLADGLLGWRSITDIQSTLQPFNSPSHSMAWMGGVKFNDENDVNVSDILSYVNSLYADTARDFDEGSICLTGIIDRREFDWEEKKRLQITKSTVLVTSKNRSWSM